MQSVEAPAARFDRQAAVTRALLGYGVVVGPFYLAVGIVQGLVRDGFDFSRHALSHLANGPGGWVQTANFALSGAMVVAAATGVARAMRPGSRAASGCLGAFGCSMIAAALFRADPIDGFPPGTPPGLPASMSTPGILHFAFGGLGFVALSISCFAMSVAMARRARPGLSRLSLLAGACVIGGFFAPLFGLRSPVAGVWVAVVAGWAWLSILSVHLYRSAPPPNC